MKTGIKTILTHKVHYLLFATACLLLAAVAVEAKIMADDLASMADVVLQEESQSALTSVQI